MDYSCKKLPSTFDEKIAELEVKRKLKKKSMVGENRNSMLFQTY